MRDPRALYTAAETRALDAFAIEQAGIAGLTLMRRAATACVDTLMARWPDARRVLVLCGSGNNAGDGYIAGGMLADKGIETTIVAVGDPAKLGADAARGYDFCRATAASFQRLEDVSLNSVDVIVDALLGTGLSGAVREDYAAVIDAINAASSPILSVDIPSGLSADTGARLGSAVSAEVTVTFIGRKRGLYTLDGPDCAGEIVFASLDVPSETYGTVAAGTRLLAADGLFSLPVRPRNAHKNMFGHVLVVGGDAGMGGAVAMSAETALRAGAGMVSVATHPAHVNAILARRPELMVRGVDDPEELLPLLARASVVVLGPGLGRSTWSSRIFRQAAATTREEDLPVVLDADGLNLMALHPESRDNWVLTPHPGEASNLLQDNRIQQDRFASIQALQSKFGGAAVLKGAGTLIQGPTRMTLCPFGNPGMSSAGMGDVLAGLIAALLAQGLPLETAAETGVLVHAMAGDRGAAATGERGLLATDLMPEIRNLMNQRVSE